MKSIALISLLCVALCDGVRMSAGGVPQHIVRGKAMDWIRPSHVHLAVTGIKSEMVVMWSSPLPNQKPVVQYWSDHSNSSIKVKATTTTYVADGYTSPYIHTAKLTELKADTTYTYRCGDGGLVPLFTPKYSFKTEPETLSRFTFLAIGDHGTSINSTHMVDAMLRELKKNEYNLIIHAGDISYANGHQPIWDDWHHLATPVSSLVPWMIAPGNHELERPSNFLSFRRRFRMPWQESGGKDPNMYFSYNYRNVHFIAVNSEAMDFSHETPQYKWLKQDLEKVDRKVTPWIFAYWHTPWYCTNFAHLNEGNTMQQSLEDLFYQHKVDVVFNGHVHAYERTHGVYRGKLDPEATVYITNGAGGTQEGLAEGWIDRAEWTAFRQSDSWGFGAVEIFNATHMRYQFKEMKMNNVLDQAWIVRNRK